MTGVAVLVSGGMDSCAMLADIAERDVAHPLYVRTGMIWEDAELASLRAYLGALASSNVRELTVLEMPAAPLLGSRHWTMSPDDVPRYSAPDAAVYIPGRNIALITLAAIWASQHDVRRVAIGTLAGNPFPDSTPEFRELLARAVSVGLAHHVDVEAPLSQLHKDGLLAAYAARYPLHLTLTCAKPHLESTPKGYTVVEHCGDCNKCRERHEAFVDAGIDDQTVYRIAVERG